MIKHHPMCISLICQGKCEKGIKIQRWQGVSIFAQQEKLPEVRKFIRELVRDNIAIIDCDIILKQLNRLLYDKQNYRNHFITKRLN